MGLGQEGGAVCAGTYTPRLGEEWMGSRWNRDGARIKRAKCREKRPRVQGGRVVKEWATRRLRAKTWLPDSEISHWSARTIQLFTTHDSLHTIHYARPIFKENMGKGRDGHLMTRGVFTSIWSFLYPPKTPELRAMHRGESVEIMCSRHRQRGIKDMGKIFGGMAFRVVSRVLIG